MRCTKCGHKLRIGDEFCSKCGTAVEPDIVYEENDVRDERADRDHTRAYKTHRGDEREEGFRKSRERGDEFQENMHDITGEVDLNDYDPEESRPRKASRWTTAGIAAAIGIAAAFVIAIIALNVQNFTKNSEPTEVGEAEETTASEETTTATTKATEETKSSGWQNPFESLFPSQREDSGSSSDSYGAESSGSGSYDTGSNSGSGSSSGSGYSQREDSSSSGQSYEGSGSSSGYHDDSGSSSSDYHDDSNSSSSDYNYDESGSSSGSYEDGSSSDYYDSGSGSSYGSDANNDNSGNYGADIQEFFEGIGGQIRDTAEDWGTQLDESINNYRERMRGRGW